MVFPFFFFAFQSFRLGHVWYLGTYLSRSPLGIYWLWLWKPRNALTLIDNLHTMHVNIGASTSGYYLFARFLSRSFSSPSVSSFTIFFSSTHICCSETAINLNSSPYRFHFKIERKLYYFYLCRAHYIKKILFYRYTFIVGVYYFE